MELTTNIIFILGGPGCGKSTLCKTITKSTNWIHISVGDLLRQEIQLNTNTGKIIKHHIENSIIVPDDITFDLLIHELKNYEGKSILVDGYPRNKENKTYFETNKPQNIIIKKVLYLMCEDEIMLNRIANRRTDIARIDDGPEIIKSRIKAYKEYTLPLMTEYAPDIVEQVDCSKTPSEIFNNVKCFFIN